MLAINFDSESNEANCIDILGVGLSLYNQRQLLSFVAAAIQNRSKALVLSGNIYSFNLAYEQSWLRTFFNKANIVRLDGAGVRLGARLLGYDTPPRMTWADFAWQLAASAEQNGHTLFFLGAQPGIAQDAAAVLEKRYPNLQIIGTQHGYFNKRKDDTENKAVLAKINEHSPDILLVGFGMPLQEQWLSENYDQIDARVVMTGGAVFDYISGRLRRGPAWMTDYGMEWLARLFIEPKRLWRRYLLGNPLFVCRILKQKLNTTFTRH